MLYAIVAVAILICDQAMKLWINMNVVPGSEPLQFIPGFISLENVHNTGAAFGMFSDSPFARWFFIVLTIIVCIGLIIVLANNIVRGSLPRWMIVFIIAGGIGNLVDRFINGYVVDMFSFDFWPSFAVFNIADIFLTIGAIVLCLYLIFHREPKTEEDPVRPPRERAPAKPQREKVDYLSQLQKPVVEGREAMRLEAERKAREAEMRSEDGITPTEPIKQPSREFAEWNMPFDEQNARKNASVSSVNASKPDSALVEFELKTSPPKSTPSDSPTKPKDEFSLDSILSEFSDK